MIQGVHDLLQRILVRAGQNLGHRWRVLHLVSEAIRGRFRRMRRLRGRCRHRRSRVIRQVVLYRYLLKILMIILRRLNFMVLELLMIIYSVYFNGVCFFPSKFLNLDSVSSL